MGASWRFLQMVDQARLSLSLRVLRAFKRREDLLPALQNLCERYGLSHISFLVVHSGGNARPYPYYCTTYPDTWTQIYVDKRYFDIDPVIHVVRSELLPVDWSALDRQPRKVQNFFREARSYGIGPHGLTIPIRGRNGERSLFSVASDLPKREWARLRASSIHELHILSHYFHEAALSASGLREDDRYRTLSGREGQCLQLLAKGRISKQIAADLGISQNAVKLYLRSARLKLGAATSHQAVGRATFLELIEI